MFSMFSKWVLTQPVVISFSAGPGRSPTANEKLGMPLFTRGAQRQNDTKLEGDLVPRFSKGEGGGVSQVL